MEVLDPKTPREHLEACHRIIATFEELWNELPDGDGDEGLSNEEVQTKTDMFILIAGCADYGIVAIKEQNDVKRLLTF